MLGIATLTIVASKKARKPPSEATSSTVAGLTVRRRMTGGWGRAAMSGGGRVEVLGRGVGHPLVRRGVRMVPAAHVRADRREEVLARDRDRPDLGRGGDRGRPRHVA